MFKITHSEIILNLEILGLSPGANHDDIRSAFRKLALELHPDVSGSGDSEKFRSVNNAYAALKNLSENELEAVTLKIKDFRTNLKQISKIDSIIDKYELKIKNLNQKVTSQKYKISDKFLNAIIFRLRSNNPKIINIALKNSSQAVDNINFKRALTKILLQNKIDNQTALLVSHLKFDDDSRRFLAVNTINNAKNFPLSLILALISEDYDLLEKFLLQVKPEYVAPLIRRLPLNKIPSQNLVKNLLSSNLPEVLVPILSLLKQHFPLLASQHRARLSELSNHEAPTVRAWARSL